MPQSRKQGLQHDRVRPKLLVPAASTLSLSSDPLPLAVGLYSLLSGDEKPASTGGGFPPYRFL